MTSHANVAARGVNTIEWLSEVNATFTVPVYQRQYRWTTDGCAQLLKDIRAVADQDERQTHFIGSILSTRTTTGDLTDVVLVDGQQRITTLVLLIAALHEAVRTSDPKLAMHLATILVHPTRPNATRLGPHSYRAGAFVGIVFQRGLSQAELGSSSFDENYEFFLSAIHDDAPRVWRGLQKLEHVDIGLLDNANPQQVFESINSTGAPLRNNELIHNYVLMGLPPAYQQEVESIHWLPIEQNTGVAIDDFLRDYLIHRTGKDADFSGEHGIYTVFQQEYPNLKIPELVTGHAAEWKRFSEIYRRLLDPTQEPDEQIARQLVYINVFGRAMYPLLLGVFREFQLERIGKRTLIQIMEKLQTLFLRKMTVGESRDHLIAQLCRRRNGNQTEDLIRDIERKTPSDGRVRTALKYNKVPHVGYVLGRLESEDLQIAGELEVEHIFPATQSPTWSGDGNREWAEFRDEERAKYRELLNSLGNLTLLEQPLNAGASNMSFAEKKSFYRESEVPSTRALTELPLWDSDAIEVRTDVLSSRFLQIWSVPPHGGEQDGSGLTPILDVAKKPGFYPGHKTEFEYVQFRGEIWEVRSNRELFRRLFTLLWETNHAQLLAMVGTKDSPVFESRKWRGQWERLGLTHYLFIGMMPQYALAAVQNIVDRLDIADDLLVKLLPEED